MHNKRISLLALAAAAMAGVHSQATAIMFGRSSGVIPMPGADRPRRISVGIPGMGYGSKVRGNRAVQRAAAKARNVKRHRAHCRGRS